MKERIESSLAVLQALAPLLLGAPLEQCLPLLRAPRLYYAAARACAREEGGGGGLWDGGGGGGGGDDDDGSAAVVAHALTSAACRVTAGEAEELGSNFAAYHHIRDWA